MGSIDGLHQGAVIIAPVMPPGGRGKAKVRPLVVLSDQVVMNRPITCVAISTSVYPDNPAAILLPWSAQWPVQTGLRRRSFAVCDWLVALDPTEVLEKKGYVPTKTLLQIVQRVNEFTGG